MSKLNGKSCLFLTFNFIYLTNINIAAQVTTQPNKPTRPSPVQSSPRQSSPPPPPPPASGQSDQAQSSPQQSQEPPPPSPGQSQAQSSPQQSPSPVAIPPPQPSVAPQPPVRVRQSPSPPTSPGKKGTTILIVVLVVAFVIIIFIVCIILMWRKKTIHVTCFEFGIKTKDSNEPKFREYEFGMVKAATNDFSEKINIEEDGFGSVYKGELDGRLIAVKRLSSDSKQLVELEFRSQVELVASLQHPNLVRLLGFCLGEERLLIYEFLPTGSLDEFLSDPNKRARLDWGTSYKIIEGVARGLLYLHEDTHQRINHCNLKASNVLLDSNMDPKITDFGITRLFAPDETQGNTVIGYMPPEYARHQYGQISMKLDVFSFGVLVLEIIKGQMCQSFRNDDGLNLLSYAWESWVERTTSKMMIDSRLLNEQDSLLEISKSIHIALLCVQESDEARPSMSSVVDMLKNNVSQITQEEPSQPGFYNHNGTCKPSQKLAMAA